MAKSAKSKSVGRAHSGGSQPAKRGKLKALPKQKVFAASGGVGLKIARWNDWEASERISEGLSTSWLEDVRETLDLSAKELGHAVQISPRTLSRRKSQETLPPDESERVYRILKLVQLATDVFGDSLDARNWMKEANYSLAEKTPLEVARTEPGAGIVARLLEQIRYGIAV